MKTENAQKMGAGIQENIQDTQKAEKKLKEATKAAFSLLEEAYPELKFRIRARVYLAEMADNLVNEGRIPLENSVGVNPKFFINPDGKFIEVFVPKLRKWQVLCISEFKSQKSPVGNAFERACKNISACRNWLKSLSYFPYILFYEGAFRESEKLMARLQPTNWYYPISLGVTAELRDLNLYCKCRGEENHQVYSHILKELTFDEITEVLKKMCLLSLDQIKF